MKFQTEARLEAMQTINHIRSLGACLLIVYKPNLIDRYLRTVPKTVAIGQGLRALLRKQAEEIALILKEEATKEDYQ